VGNTKSLSEHSRDLVFMKYKRDLTDFVTGYFRVKGDVVDIFMPYDDYPIRLEYWGDEIERISYIEPLTAHKISEVSEVEIFPSKNFVFDAETINLAVSKIRQELSQAVEKFVKAGKHLEAERLKQRTEYDLEMLSQVGYCKGMENYSVYFEGREHGDPPYTLLDYFPDDYLLFIDESHITVPQVGGMYNGDKARKQTLVDYGFRLPSAIDNRPLNFEEFRQRQGNTIYVSATPGDWETDDSKGLQVELLTRPTGLLDPVVDQRPTENQIDDVINEVDKTVKKGQRVLITTLTKKMSEDLSAYLSDIGIKVHYLHSGQDTVERVDVLRDLRLGEYDVLVGINLLREGIDLPEVSLVIILDADKEGFLRSKTSLVQTMGRAARHQDGRVILYADKMTDSMKYAIDVTEKRRRYQQDYNKKYHITPTTIQKAIRDKLVEKEEAQEVDYKKWVEESRPPKHEIKQQIKALQEKMFIAAENLQFEKAAELRDQIKELRELV
ncbi:UvrB/UvrC motif-containing protein, partial [Candidatus Dojkabacteria bacterium]|nr:UvrB/UvrC motif-containing protein [Candidatus Dojkabacteria bacterium]